VERRGHAGIRRLLPGSDQYAHGWENAERVIGDAKKYGVNLLMQFEGEPGPTMSLMR